MEKKVYTISRVAEHNDFNPTGHRHGFGEAFTLPCKQPATGATKQKGAQ